MNFLRVAVLGTAAAVFTTLAVFAADKYTSGHYVSDPAHSSVTFKIRHMGLSNVQGHFDKFSADININYEHPEKSSVTATVDTNSVNTGVEARDNHLRTADFFDVATYPTITFKSSSVKPLKGDMFEVTGDLTMKGVTKPLTITVEHIGTLVDPKKGEKAGFESTFTLDRTQYGMAPVAFLGNDVTLTIEVEAGVPQPPKAAAVPAKTS